MSYRIQADVEQLRVTAAALREFNAVLHNQHQGMLSKAQALLSDLFRGDFQALFEDTLTTFDPRVYALSDTAADWATKLEAFAQRLEVADASLAVVTFGSPPLKQPLPKIYIINGINSTAKDGEPDKNAIKLMEAFRDYGYPADEVLATNAIYNRNITTDFEGTKLKGTELEGTKFEGSQFEGTQLSEDQGGGVFGFGRRMITKGINKASDFGANSLNAATSFTAWSANTITGASATSINTLTGTGAEGINKTTMLGTTLINESSEIANKAIGAAEVVQEYHNGENGRYTQEVYQFIKDHPPAPGQKVIVIGYSGGGAPATNLSAMLERDGIDVQGVVTSSAPAANTDLASKYAKVVDINDKGDVIAQRIRSEEARNPLNALQQEPLKVLQQIMQGKISDSTLRDSNANIVNHETNSTKDAHGYHVGEGAPEVVKIVIDEFVNGKEHTLKRVD
ncbi:pentapeptide repeat-containing protein [Herpetosiphon llansteffanensis]